MFDKNDIQTVTKVLMSEHVFSDPVLRLRLEMKGEPFLRKPGSCLNCRQPAAVEARIVDLTYGVSALTAASYFQRATIEWLYTEFSRIR